MITGAIRSAPGVVIKAIKKLRCPNAIGFYMANEWDELIGISPAGDGTTVTAIPGYSFFDLRLRQQRQEHAR